MKKYILDLVVTQNIKLHANYVLIKLTHAIAGFLFVTGDGEVLCYQRAFRQTFADFLFQNSRLEKGSTEKDKYGYLERENGVYYFKLNLKIGLLKR